jgi:hypothetical protein
VGEPASVAQLDFSPTAAASLQQHRAITFTLVSSSLVLAAHPGSVQCSRRTRSLPPSSHVPCIASSRTRAPPDHNP